MGNGLSPFTFYLLNHRVNQLIELVGFIKLKELIEFYYSHKDTKAQRWEMVFHLSPLIFTC